MNSFFATRLRITPTKTVNVVSNERRDGATLRISHAIFNHPIVADRVSLFRAPYHHPLERIVRAIMFEAAKSVSRFHDFRRGTIHQTDVSGYQWALPLENTNTEKGATQRSQYSRFANLSQATQKRPTSLLQAQHVFLQCDFPQHS